MKRILSILFAVVLLATLTAGTVVAAPALHKVTGGGTVDWSGGRVTYGITAQQVDAAGNAKGQFQVFHRDVFSEPKVHGKVLYLAVDTATGSAWIGGVVTKSMDSFPAVGDEFVFGVQDNGEGKKATGPDEITSVMYGGSGTAALALVRPFPVNGRLWTNGNVQVK